MLEGHVWTCIFTTGIQNEASAAISPKIDGDMQREGISSPFLLP